MKKFWLPILFSLLAIAIFKPILGSIWYPVHDTTSVARAYLLEKSLAAGQIPALWAAELNGGAGYPLFHFYAPLTAYLALFFKSLTGSYFTGLKVTLVLAALIGALGMSQLMKKQGRIGAIVSAFAYILLPYGAVNLYVRGAYAEYLSMMILPWLFYAWQDLSSLKRQLSTSFITTLFILSHNLIPFITAPFLLAWVLLHHKSNLKLLFFPIFMTLLLSSFYLLPLVFERNFVQADQVSATTNYADHFVVPWQLWNSTWGFGGSGVGVEDGMSFKIGKIQVILAILGSALIILKRRSKELFFVFAGLISIFMTTNYSTFIWQSVPYQRIVQFPWRYLTLIGFFTSILAGYAFGFIKNKFLSVFTCVLVTMTLLVINLKLFMPQSIFPAELSRYTNPAYLATIPEIIPEYAPTWLSRHNDERLDTTVLPYNYYPTWTVTLNGKSVPTYASTDGSLAFSNPTHSTNYFARQSHTWLEFVSSIISLITLIYLIKLYVKN